MEEHQPIVPRSFPRQSRPSPKQIAQLNALLHESKSLSRQINTPAVNLSLIMTIELLRLLGINNLGNRYGHILTEENEDFVWLEIFMVAIPFLVITSYLFYICYQKLSDLCLSQFPNGIHYERLPHSAYQLQHKLGTKEEVATAIDELERLIIQQRKTKDRYFYISLTPTLLIFYLFPSALILSGINTRLAGTYLFQSFRRSLTGPAFRLLTPPDDPISYFFILCSALQNQGTIDFWRYGYNKYSNYNLPKQITLFRDQIKELSCLSFIKKTRLAKKIKRNAIELIGNRTSKEAIMLYLHPVEDIKEKKLIFFDKNNNSHKISKYRYLAELHRILIKAKIPVYHAENNKIYIGFFSLDKKNMDRLKTTFEEKLIFFETHEQKCEEIIMKLNNTLPGQEISWQYYLVTDKSGNIQPCYYLDQKHMPMEMFSEFYSKLSKIIPSHSLTFESNPCIITICELNDNAIEKLLSSRILNQKKLPWTQNNPNDLIERKLYQDIPRNPQQSPPDQEESIEIKPEVKKSHPPEKIYFCGDQYFFKPPANKPYQEAYRIRLPWLSPNTPAYGSIDPKVFEVVKPHLPNKKMVENPLTKGAVHGARSNHHTKAGYTGIQPDTRPYKDVYQKNHTDTELKLKCGHNIEIPGHFWRNFKKPSEKNEDNKSDVQTCSHYLFDGAAYGHKRNN